MINLAELSIGDQSSIAELVSHRLQHLVQTQALQSAPQEIQIHEVIPESRFVFRHIPENVKSLEPYLKSTDVLHLQIFFDSKPSACAAVIKKNKTWKLEQLVESPLALAIDEGLKTIHEHINESAEVRLVVANRAALRLLWIQGDAYESGLIVQIAFYKYDKTKFYKPSEIASILKRAGPSITFGG